MLQLSTIEIQPALLKTMSIKQLARVITKNWQKVNYTAKPYLQAMYCMEKVTDNYGLDSGKGIILRFLCNATTWRGEIARMVKAELKARCK